MNRGRYADGHEVRARSNDGIVEPRTANPRPLTPSAACPAERSEGRAEETENAERDARAGSGEKAAPVWLPGHEVTHRFRAELA